MRLSDYDKQMSATTNGTHVVTANEVNEIKESKFFNTLARFFSSDLKTQDKEMSASPEYGKPTVSKEETRVLQESAWFNFIVAVCSVFCKVVLSLLIILTLGITKTNPLFGMIIFVICMYFVWRKKK